MDLVAVFHRASVIKMNRDRARGYPLSVKFEVRPGTKWCWADGQPLFWDPRRLRALRVQVIPKEAQTFLDRITSDDHPCLEDLDVVSVFRDMSFASNRDPLPEDAALVRLPGTFLRTKAPKLKRLYLVDISPPWSSLCNLTTFTATWTETWSQRFEPDWTIRDILEALGRCSKLETLIISSPGLPASVPEEPLPIAAIPGLHVLRLSGPAGSCGQLLKHIALPSSTRMTFHAIHSQEDVEALLPLAEGLRRHYSAGAPLMHSLLCASISVVDRGDAFLLYAYEDKDLHELSDNDEHSKPRLSVLWTHSHTRSEALKRGAALLIPTLPFQDISILDLRCARHLEATDTWTTMVANLPALRCIALHLAEEDVNLLLVTLAALAHHPGSHRILRIHLDARYLLGTVQHSGNDAVEVLHKVEAAHELFNRVVAHAVASEQLGWPLEAIVLVDAPEMLIERIHPEEVSSHLSEGFVCNGVLK